MNTTTDKRKVRLGGKNAFTAFLSP